MSLKPSPPVVEEMPVVSKKIRELVDIVGAADEQTPHSEYLEYKAALLREIAELEAKSSPPVSTIGGMPEWPNYVIGQVHFARTESVEFMDKESARKAMVWLADTLLNEQMNHRRAEAKLEADLDEVVVERYQALDALQSYQQRAEQAESLLEGLRTINTARGQEIDRLIAMKPVVEAALAWYDKVKDILIGGVPERSALLYAVKTYRSSKRTET